MTYPMSIKDIIGNALIEAVERVGKRFILFSQLDKYITTITKQLQDIDIDVIQYFNRNETIKFFYDYSYMFEIKEFSDDVYISLKSNVSSEVLRKHFRVNLPLNVLKVFTSEETISALVSCL